MGDDLVSRRAAAGRERSGQGLPPGSVLLEQDFDAGSLYVLRAAVSAHGADVGLDRGRLYDLVTVAHELAANAVRHGAGRGHLRLWLDGGLLHCEVSDAGRARAEDGQADGAEGTRRSGREVGLPAADEEGRGAEANPAANGHRAVGDRAAGDRAVGDKADGDDEATPRIPWREEHGHGLWVVSRVADQFRIDRSSATVAIATFLLDAPPDAKD